MKKSHSFSDSEKIEASVSEKVNDGPLLITVNSFEFTLSFLSVLPSVLPFRSSFPFFLSFLLNFYVLIKMSRYQDYSRALYQIEKGIIRREDEIAGISYDVGQAMQFGDRDSSSLHDSLARAQRGLESFQTKVVHGDREGLRHHVKAVAAPRKTPAEKLAEAAMAAEDAEIKLEARDRLKAKGIVEGQLDFFNGMIRMEANIRAERKLKVAAATAAAPSAPASAAAGAGSAAAPAPSAPAPSAPAPSAPAPSRADAAMDWRAPRSSAAAPASRAEVSRLPKELADYITQNYPAVYKHVGGRKFAIEFHNAKLGALSARLRKSDSVLREEVRTALKKDLEAAREIAKIENGDEKVIIFITLA